MSFGRKGQDSSMIVPSRPAVHPGLAGLHNSSRPGSAGTAPPLGSDLARKREAFIAAERARSAEARSEEARRDGRAHSTDPTLLLPERKPRRSLMMAYLLWFIAGQLSLHRFYLGAYRSGAAQVGCWVLALILIMLKAIVPGIVVFAGTLLWVLGDVFMIHRIYRTRCEPKTDYRQVFA